MSLRSKIVAQFRKPTGWPGALAGWIMAHRPSNRLRNSWTIDLLGVAPSDLVLEIGFGPGLALTHLAKKLSSGRVVGFDHSDVMLAQATSRNRDAIRSGRVEVHLGGLERLGEQQRKFDKAFSVNTLQFAGDAGSALRQLRQALVHGGLLATSYQPRHRGARAEDADAFAAKLVIEMHAAGFENVRTETLALRPVPAVCVLGAAS
jgi:SAM-dependent methyltransferase